MEGDVTRIISCKTNKADDIATRFLKSFSTEIGILVQIRGPSVCRDPCDVTSCVHFAGYPCSLPLLRGIRLISWQDGGLFHRGKKNRSVRTAGSCFSKEIRRENGFIFFQRVDSNLALFDY